MKISSLLFKAVAPLPPKQLSFHPLAAATNQFLSVASSIVSKFTCYDPVKVIQVSNNLPGAVWPVEVSLSELVILNCWK